MIEFNTCGQSIDYANNVVNGSIICGRFIRLACERFLNDLERKDLVFDKEAVNKCLSFINKLKHSTGRYANKPFILLPYQVWIIANLVGFKRLNGKNKYNTALITMARKQGKTALIAALQLYYLFAEKGAEVIFAANSKEQAKIGYDMAKNFSQSIDKKGKYLTPYRDRIKLDKTKSILRVIAADDSKLDGFNASAAVWDEGAAAKDLGVYNIIKSSMAMRDNPILISISTAGFDKNAPFYNMVESSKEVLLNLKQNDSEFIAIYMLDDEDVNDWTNENNFLKFSPSLNETVSPDFLKQEIEAAKNNPSLEVSTKTKTFNIYCDSLFEQWIPDNYIYNNFHSNSLENYSGNTCFLGLDLASTLDLTAISVMFPLLDGGYDFIQYYYLPSDTVENSPNRELYKKWYREGYLNVTNGNVTDYEYIINDINRIQSICPIEQISFDQWNSSQLNISLSEQGYNMIPFSQSISSMNRPTKELQRLILSNKVHFDKNPITSWCFKNSIPKTDWNENLKIIKASNDKKIDGVVAAIMSLGGYLTTNKYQYDLI